jgi:hypothetical protein
VRQFELHPKILILAICLFCLFAYGCKKKTPGDVLPVYEYGTISGLQANNGSFSKSDMTLSVLAKKSHIVGCGSENYDLIIEQKSKSNYYREKIFIGDLSLSKKGAIPVSYSLKTCDSLPYATIYIGDDDFRWSTYYPLKSQKNTITLSEYNKNTKEISGTFDITLVIDFGTPDSRTRYPDTVRLHDCQFKEIIND